MRAVAMLMVVVAVLLMGATLTGGAGAASHRAARAVLQDATSPSWSPDGKQIVFSYVRYAQTSCCGLQPSRYRIVRTSSRPGGAVRIVHAGKEPDLYEPLGWAAGGRIVFGVNGALYSVGVQAGGKPKRIAFSGAVPYPQDFILSPNREYAAVGNQGGGPGPNQIGLVKLNAARAVVVRTPLTAEEQSLNLSDDYLGFSPHGTQLVFGRRQFLGEGGGAGGGDFGPTALMAIRLGGGEPVPLARSGIPGASLVPSDADQVQWSPDGRRIAFVENQNLEVVRTTGASPPLVLATCFDQQVRDGFSWSPTSNLIAYACTQPNGSGQLMTVRPDGTHSANLLEDRPLIYDSAYHGEPDPEWSPDGSRLLFLAHGIGHRTVHVFTIRANGRDLTRRG